MLLADLLALNIIQVPLKNATPTLVFPQQIERTIVLDSCNLFPPTVFVSPSL